MKIADEVLAVLSAAETNGNELKLVGTLDRKMYVKVNDILEAAGGKWNKKAKAHIFEDGALERLDEIILTGEVDKPKDEFNYFPTPSNVVDRLIELAGITKAMSVLEPSAGRGAIALRCVKEGAEVDCFELMEANYDVLHNLGVFRFIQCYDFLMREPTQIFDRVVMNPPFQKQQDIKHVTHALKFLKDGGKLISVMSSSITFRENKLTKEFRDLIDERGGWIERLPEGSFKESGTMVNTCIVVIPN